MIIDTITHQLFISGSSVSIECRNFSSVFWWTHFQGLCVTFNCFIIFALFEELVSIIFKFLSLTKRSVLKYKMPFKGICTKVQYSVTSVYWTPKGPVKSSVWENFWFSKVFRVWKCKVLCMCYNFNWTSVAHNQYHKLLCENIIQNDSQIILILFLKQGSILATSMVFC